MIANLGAHSKSESGGVTNHIDPQRLLLVAYEDAVFLAEAVGPVNRKSRTAFREFGENSTMYSSNAWRPNSSGLTLRTTPQLVEYSLVPLTTSDSTIVVPSAQQIGTTLECHPDPGSYADLSGLSQ